MNWEKLKTEAEEFFDFYEGKLIAGKAALPVYKVWWHDGEDRDEIILSPSIMLFDEYDPALDAETIEIVARDCDARMICAATRGRASNAQGGPEGWPGEYEGIFMFVRLADGTSNVLTGILADGEKYVRDRRWAFESPRAGGEGAVPAWNEEETQHGR